MMARQMATIAFFMFKNNKHEIYETYAFLARKQH